MLKRIVVPFCLEDVIADWLADNGYEAEYHGHYFELRGEKVDPMTDVVVFIEEPADD